MEGGGSRTFLPLCEKILAPVLDAWVYIARTEENCIAWRIIGTETSHLSD